ncbi:hypothetical protein FA571_29235 [Pseudomonas aeruginosa]|nr:hypothetical protein [Pseudomonas aeruginosa]
MAWNPHLDENYTPGLSHAMLDSAEASLCGIGRNHFGSAIYSGLARVDGQVGCKDCMAELERLNLVGGYAGPRTFVMDRTEVDGVLLESFGWGVFDKAYEHFFAFGHHEPGVVLEIARRLAGNALAGWGEHHTTIYAHWMPPSEDGETGAPCCYRLLRKSETLHPHDTEPLRVEPIEVTVLRYEAWPLLQERDGDADYECRRFKAWFDGSTKLGRAPTPADIDAGDAPGFVVYGMASGSTEKCCLEWPTPDFDVALKQLAEWRQVGATELHILNHGSLLPMSMLTPDVNALIQHGLKVYGRDHYVMDILTHGVD